MKQYVLVVAAVGIISLFNIVESRSIVKRQIQLDTSLDPVANVRIFFVVSFSFGSLFSHLIISKKKFISFNLKI